MMKKVLIAEDEANIRQLVHIALKDEGYELVEVGDGAEALSKALEIRPALIVLDIMMPKRTGYEVCRTLKGNPDTRGIKILFLTSRTGLPAEHAMKEAGGDGILTKPFIPNELKRKVKAMLQAPKTSPKRSPLANAGI